MLTKICTHCHKTLPCNSEYFHRSKRHKGGYKNICKECVSEQMHQYYKLKHQDDIFIKNRVKYKDTYNCKISNKITSMKHTAKFHYKMPEYKLTLTTKDFMIILSKFNNCCCTCGSRSNVIPTLAIRLHKPNSSISFNNILPMCHDCNTSYHRKIKLDFTQWYQSQSFYSNERLNKILEHTRGQK